MAARQRYVPSLTSQLGAHVRARKGIRPDVLESYKWFELARRQLEVEGKANIDRHLRGKIEAALEQLSNRLGPQAVQEAKTRAAQSAFFKG